jgi:hypothetical protein
MRLLLLLYCAVRQGYAIAFTLNDRPRTAGEIGASAELWLRTFLLNCFSRKLSLSGPARVVTLLVLLLLCGRVSAAPSTGSIQFDVFLGHEGIVSDATWFPVTIEVKNDEKSFSGSIELRGGIGVNQVRVVSLELPTGSLKRITIPAFAPTGGYSTWDALLRNAAGEVVAQHTDLRPRLQLAPFTPLMGHLSRTPTGGPQIHPTALQDRRMQPAIARLLPGLLPDNPLYLEGVTCIYLNSDKAGELTPAQAGALVAWAKQGGHLVLAIEEIQHVESSPWLAELAPCRLTGIQSAVSGGALQQWISGKWEMLSMAVDDDAMLPSPNPGKRPRSPGSGRASRLTNATWETPFAELATDFAFETSQLRVATCSDVRAEVQAAAGNLPLVLKTALGAGELTVLLFSPEREPARSWANLPVFWAKVAQVPPSWFVSSDFQAQTGWSTDAVFGALLDTRQARTIPIGWLLLLFLGYLVVIGPLDYFYLRRLRRPMLTWLTFPAYVVAFSGLIYFIAFKLRSGDLEWNELHIVDVFQAEGKPAYRGRTYASLYSSANREYDFRGPAGPAVFRGESAGGWGRGAGMQPVWVQHHGESFAAKSEVPVWASQIFACDWLLDAPPPCELELRSNEAGPVLEVSNRSSTQLSFTCIKDGKLYRFGHVAAGQTTTLSPQRQAGQEISAFSQAPILSAMQSAVSMRRMPFGGHGERFVDDWQAAVQALSVPARRAFVPPPGLELSHALRRDGAAVVFVWAEDLSPIPRIPAFETKRSRVKTVWRVMYNDRGTNQ